MGEVGLEVKPKPVEKTIGQLLDGLAEHYRLKEERLQKT